MLFSPPFGKVGQNFQKLCVPIFPKLINFTPTKVTSIKSPFNSSIHYLSVIHSFHEESSMSPIKHKVHSRRYPSSIPPELLPRSLKSSLDKHTRDGVMSYGIATEAALSLTFPIVNFDAQSPGNEWPSYILRARSGPRLWGADKWHREYR